MSANEKSLLRRADLSPAKAALLKQKLKRLSQPADRARREAIPRCLDPRSAPLSFAQKRLWFLDRMEPGLTAYNLPGLLRIDGRLETRVLEHSLTALGARHEALRTRFPAVRGTPVQEVAPPQPTELPVVDLGALAPVRQEAEALRLRRASAGWRFDLPTGPLVLFRLLRFADDRHLLLVNLHHIVADGWSLGILLRDLIALYREASGGPPANLRRLPIQYADFAAWQEQWLAGERLERQLTYWRNQLAGAPTFLELPTDRPRPSVQSFVGDQIVFRLPGRLTAGCFEIAHHERATPFMILLAAFAVLLRLETGQEEVVVGSPIANRSRPEIQDLIGVFVNVLALRVNLSGRPSFRQLLRRVRDLALAAYAHQDLPFERLVEELGLERRTGNTPLFQVTFALEEDSFEPQRLAGLTLIPQAEHRSTAKFDLSLTLERDGTLFAGSWTFRRDLFDRSTIERRHRMFVTVLDQVTAPDRPVEQFELLGAYERQQLLVEWNDTVSHSFLEKASIHARFDAQARRHPGRPAVSAASQELDYGELDKRSGRLAAELRARGVTQETVVGLLLERSVELVTGMLAILKAGGAYLPLDPQAPPERLIYMLEDSAALLLVSRSRLARPLNSWTGAVLCLDRQLPASSPFPKGKESFRYDAHPDQLAYVIYTSGSTGRPKGIEVTHRGLCNLATWYRRTYGVVPEDRVSQMAALGFDATVLEIWPSLASGASVHMVPDEVRTSARDVSRWLEASSIHLCFVPTPLAEMMMDESWPAESSLRNLLTGGDRLHRSPPAGHPLRLVNLYGPTENTVVSTAGSVARDPGQPSIGRPISNVQVYVLDERQQPLPLGVPGELCLGGPSLARGYRSQPRRTALSFFPNPHSGRQGDRHYRSGDLVRWWPDGRLDFLGRIDHQIKLRGFRIEPGEIESVLEEHPEVEQAIVEVCRDPRHEPRLVAYVVGVDGAPMLSDLPLHLRRRVPEYMVPGTFVSMAEVPLTPSGKVDRQALPEPRWPELPAEGLAAAPRSPFEEMVAEVWADVLGRQRVGWQENFFELGGHSLLATTATSRLEELLGVAIPLRQLFDTPTLEEFTKAIECVPDSGASVAAPPAPGTWPRGEHPPLSFAQERFWLLDQLDPGTGLYNIPLAVRLRGCLEPAVMAASLGELLRRHEILRSKLTADGGRPRQEILPWSSYDLPQVDLTGIATRTHTLNRLAAAEGARAFNVTKPPLLRALLLRLESDEHVLLVTLHHIVADGWSVGVLLHELAALYRALGAARPSLLPALPIQYADFAAWQRQWLTGEQRADQLAYWRRRLAQAPALELGYDRPRSSGRGRHGASCVVAIPGSIIESLRSLTQETGVTLFMVLMAAFQTLLHRHSGQRDLTVGTPIANRRHPQFENLIGPFVNTLVLRADLWRVATVRKLLDQVRRRCLEAYAHQDLPFERLVQDLEPERSLHRTPLFQVMLALQNMPLEELALPGLVLELLETPSVTAKFDLTLLLIPEHGRSLRGTLEYDRDLFDPTTVARLLGHYHHLLADLGRNSYRRLDSLNLLSPAERQQLFAEWNDTLPQDPGEELLYDLFEIQAKNQGEAVALVHGHERLSYGALERRAGHLARRLYSRGVEPETRVGVCFERTPEMLVALLAVLRAGGVYVPLDSSYPSHRLAMILADGGGVSMVLTQRSLACRFEEAAAADVLCLESLEEQAYQVPGEIPGEIGIRNLAYLIYTSGSTGRPKGVAIEHRQATALVRWARLTFTPEELQGVFASTSINFDLSIFEIFVTLAAGGRVILDRDALELEQLPAASEVTLINTVPSAMAELLRLDALPPALKTVNLAGEVLPQSQVEEIVRGPAPIDVYNLYGPSEDTTYSTYARARSGEKPMIGRPILGTRCYVVDPWLRFMPVGGYGELCLGGSGLARGYFARPGLTAARFVPDPFTKSHTDGSRLYRTGDLVRFHADGRLDFLDRIDHQVKLRGFRIELGEIETSLSSHPGVREAVVVTHEAKRGAQLLAYLVATDESKPTDRKLRQHLSTTLPAYMLPAAFQWLGALPRNINGKIDRQALAPYGADEHTAEPHRAALTPIEEILANLGNDLLGLHRWGPQDDFFAAGGHSLLATRLTARIRQVFGIEIPLVQVFEAPTLSALAAAIEEARADTSAPAALQLAPAPHDADPVVSFAQERFWFLHRFAPRGALYNIYRALRLHGRLETSALNKSFAAVLGRQASLRTVFPEVDGVPRPKIVSLAEEVTIPLVDLRLLRASSRLSIARRWVREEIERPFDLSRSPLVRLRLLRLEEEEHVVICTVHHIVADGWSMGLLIEELAFFYNALVGARRPELPGLPVQYADFAYWQRRWLHGEALELALAFWRRKLGGELPVLDLPTDRPRPAIQTYRGSRHNFVLSFETDSAMAFCRRQGVTPFMLLLATFKILLSRYSGQSDLLVGTPLAQRTHRELEGLIGLFINTLVLRTDLAGEPSFRELLVRLRETCLEAYSYCELPFEKLLQEVQVERSLGHSPIFQILFTLQNAPSPAVAMEDIEPLPFEIHNQTATFEWDLALEETDHGWRGGLTYLFDLFDRATILRAARHFATLLAATLAEPDRAIGELDLLTSGERRQLLDAWNATGREFPALDLYRLFERRVRRHPNRPAILEEGGVVTYGDLERRAGQLGRRLRQLGVGPENRVGICLERSPKMLVALLGVLKAGGAYVPLDTAHPKRRLAYVLDNAGIRALVTQSAVAACLPAAPGTPRILLDDSRSEDSGENVALESETGPDNLAYVIYTSGSTALPKGVMIPHRAIVNFLISMAERPGLDEADLVLSVTTLSFDIAALELFLPLTLGARLVIASHDEATDGALLISRLAASNATALQATPATWRMLLEAGWGGQQDLKVFCGGEALPRPLANRLLHRASAVWNLYGPTETTVWSTVGRVSTRGPVNVGRPIANTRIHVLSPRSVPVPIGVPGELQIAGTGLARGYLGRPGLTAATFVPDHLGREPGARLYRTGDLGRYLPDGEIEILQRLDHQVKVRGFRIELGEIESALTRHPAIRSAVAVARQLEIGERHLVAYVTLEEPSDGVDKADLHRFLKAWLPGYMVPSIFVVLDALPLTPNGKLDRRALPAPQSDGGRRAEPETAPRDAIEEMVAAQWSETLRIEPPGIHEDFFTLGGHSLLATRLITRLNGQFGIDLMLREFFEAPTVAGLAQRVAGRLRGSGTFAVLPIMQLPRHEELPLSYSQRRLWFLDRLEPGSAFYNIPAAVRLEGEIQVPRLEICLREVVRRHEVLRTSFESSAGKPRQRIFDAVDVSLPVVCCAELPTASRDAELRRWTRETARQPFDLACPPLLRATLIRMGKREQVLLLVLHHIVADGWSIGVLVRELAALYRSLGDGVASTLPALSIQYSDYAGWQSQWLAGEAYASQLAYWKRQLGGELPVVELPTDSPRPAIQSFDGAARWSAVPGPLARDLTAFARSRGVTSFMVLLAGFKALLSRWTHLDDIAVGTPVANRTRPEFQELIGFFGNTLVLRTRLAGNPCFSELLLLVKRVALEAYSYQDLPFEGLVEELDPERDPSRNPLFQIMFAYQRGDEPAFEIPGLKLSTLPVDSGTSRFDLTLFVWDEPEGLAAQFEYNTDLFASSTIARLEQQWLNLLRSAMEHPGDRLGELALLSAAQRQQVILEWNGSILPNDRGGVHRFFERQAERTPDAIAVELGGRRLSYRELDGRANQLAHHLGGLGLGHDDRVGLMLDRSLDMTTAVLGVLKAGGCCVPLDPNYPEGRLGFLLEDCRTRILLTEDRWLARFPALAGKTLVLGLARRDMARQPSTSPRVQVAPEHLAYTIYTSGSTGQPKGVMISHGCLSNLVSWQLSGTRPHGRARTLQFAALSFDVSFQEMLTTWAAGGTLILISEQLRRNTRGLLRKLDEARVERLFLPFVALQHVASVSADTGRVPAHLRELITAGEQLRITEPVAGFFAQLPGSSLWNHYGPSESHAATSFRLDSPPWQWPGLPPIGRPILNARVHLLDARFEPVSIGVTGELHIGGVTQARGYLDRPALTGERFRPDSYSGAAGTRLYKTGDLARYRSDGEIEFLGRTDRQIKVRGFRIEPGEIETLLERHAAVADVAVTARSDGAGGYLLAAFVVAMPGTEVSFDELRAMLRSQMPEYMIPSYFVHLDTLPLTPSGKVDLKSLPELSRQHAAAPAYVSPRTRLERQIARAWQAVLGIDRVGIDDGFFDLGGHSLRMVELQNQLHEILGKEIPLMELFRNPTVASQARFFDPGQEQKTAVPDVRESVAARARARQRAMARRYTERKRPSTPRT